MGSKVIATVFSVDDPVRLRVAPGGLRAFQGRRGHVIGVYPSKLVQLVDVSFDEDMGVRPDVRLCIPAPYLERVSVAPEKRRSPLNMRVQTDERSEQEKQQEVIDFLVRAGYRVMVAGQYQKKAECKRCGFFQWGDKGYGNSPGFPDISITHDTRFPPGVWFMVEFKKSADATRRAEQVELVNAGRSVFCWSLPMAIEAVLSFEAGIGIEPLPILLAWKRSRGDGG